MPTEEERAHCRHCGKAIIWYFDRDDDTEIVAGLHGWWYDAERMTEACGGVDGEPDDDLWHEPAITAEPPSPG